MSFRFRRRIKILPGLYLNASKSGLSFSITGMLLGLFRITHNFGRKKQKQTLGIPGTGMAWQRTLSAKGIALPIAFLVAGLLWCVYYFGREKKTRRLGVSSKGFPRLKALKSKTSDPPLILEINDNPKN